MLRKRGKPRFCSTHCREDHNVKSGFLKRISQLKRKPSGAERKFIEICERYALPFRYVGDGKFWIENLNPDFVECNGRKIAVEIFSSYWHSPLRRRNIPSSQTFEGRKEILKKYGWDCIIFWDNEVTEEKVLEVMKSGYVQS